jgi:hypothetical protein
MTFCQKKKMFTHYLRIIRIILEFNMLVIFIIKICPQVLSQQIKNAKIIRSSFMVGVQITALSLICVSL